MINDISELKIPKGFDGFVLKIANRKISSLILQGTFSREEIEQLNEDLPKVLEKDIPELFKEENRQNEKLFRYSLNGRAMVQNLDLALLVTRNAEEEEKEGYQVLGIKIPEPINKPVMKMSIASSDLNTLSKREREILPLVLQGLNNEQISEMLFISKHTIDGHRSKIYKKMVVHSFKELVRKMAGDGGSFIFQ
jgi:ATP/maltotriose-dependent transcriptional regulator MalT